MECIYYVSNLCPGLEFNYQVHEQQNSIKLLMPSMSLLSMGRTTKSVFPKSEDYLS